ncbi:serine aminopeptidase domain-containing protein [Parahaliea mediterranea]|uniref:serine aminopeptidase domain-containing protein n=1 Tax=Parahaliea mediterranea TaxID=651086 RepID=UPI000E2F0593|nr:alpha/beta hydrolase [Parahaliea mediterranea]
MTAVATGEQLSARYLGVPGERVFTLSFQPQQAARGQVLYLPPFAEEMNRCRALAAAQARQFAAAGYGCTLMDYRGTGDSDGVFEAVSLQDWLADVGLVLDDIAQRYSQPPLLWGIRSGCLLGACTAGAANASSTVTNSTAASAIGTRIAGLLMLQPVVSGRRFVRQLVRQRIAAAVERGAGETSSEDIQQRWQAGESVEIGGYQPSARLMLELEQMELTDFNLAGLPLRWLEHLGEGQDEPGLAVQRMLDTLREGGAQVELHGFAGPAIWQLNERAATPELLDVLGALYRP